MLTGLQNKLQETQEECMRLTIQVESEARERRKQESKNGELNGKLSDCRQGLRDTQSALQNVQQAMQQLTMKKDQKEILYHRVVAENKVYESKIADLEIRVRDGESTSKTVTVGREAVIEQIKEQLSVSQDSLYRVQTECTRLKGEKTLIEAEMEACRRKLLTLESKFKHKESDLHSEYVSEIDRLQEKVRIYSEKLEHFKNNDSLVLEMTSELRDKSMQLKSLDSHLLESETTRRDLETKISQLESHIRTNDSLYRSLENKSRQQELDANVTGNELTSMKRSAQQSEEMMREVAYQLQQVNIDKQDLKEKLILCEEKLLKSTEQGDLVNRLRKELDAVTGTVEEYERHASDQERIVRMSTDDKHNAENHSKAAVTRLSSALSSEQEARQLLTEANIRISELFDTVSSLSARAETEHARADRLERELGNNSFSASLVSLTSSSSSALSSSLHSSRSDS